MEKIIREFLAQHGVDCVGFTSAEDFEEWHTILMKRIGDELFPTDHPYVLCSDPRKFLAEARSVIAFAVKYDGLTDVKDQGKASISGVMWTRKREKETVALLIDFLKESGFKAIEGFYIPEKAAAVRAGIAVQRKNTIAYFGDYGSAARIGTVITDLELPSESVTVAESCGDCTLCLDACPTGALVEDHTLDARRCLTFMTEEDSEFPKELRPKLGNRILACDVCQLVCPHNKEIPRLSFDEVRWLELKSLGRDAIQDPEALNSRFREQVLFYVNSDYVLSRAIAICLGNWGDPEIAPLLLHMEESRFPEVAEAAEWALEQVKQGK